MNAKKAPSGYPYKFYQSRSGKWLHPPLTGALQHLSDRQGIQSPDHADHHKQAENTQPSDMSAQIVSDPIDSAKHHNQEHLMHDNGYALFSAGEFFHRQLRPRFDFIADTPDHFQIPRFFRIDFDFFPDMPDVDSNCIVSANCFFIPDFLINLTDGKYFSFIFH